MGQSCLSSPCGGERRREENKFDDPFTGGFPPSQSSPTTPHQSTATQHEAAPSLSSYTSVKSLATELDRPPDDDEQKPPSTTAPNSGALEMKASDKNHKEIVCQPPPPQKDTTPKQEAFPLGLQLPSSPTTPGLSTATKQEPAPSLSSSTSVKYLATDVETEASSINPEPPVPQENTTPKRVASPSGLQLPSPPMTPFHTTSTQHATASSLSSSTSVKFLAAEEEANKSSLQRKAPQSISRPKQVLSRNYQPCSSLPAPSGPPRATQNVEVERQPDTQPLPSTSTAASDRPLKMKASDINPKTARHILKKNRVMLEKNGVFQGDIRAHLLEDDILTAKEAETVEAKGPRHQQMSKLVDIMLQKSDEHVVRGFKCLATADLRLYEQLDLTPEPTPMGDAPNVGGDLSMIRNELTEWYKSKMATIHPLPWCGWLEHQMDHVYTNLCIMPGRKHEFSRSLHSCILPNSDKGERDRGDENKESDEVNDGDDFLKSSHTDESDEGEVKYDNDEVNNGPEVDKIETVSLLDKVFNQTDGQVVCLIEGKAGIGKSILCRRCAYLWSKSDGLLCNRKFDLVILLTANILTGDLKSDIAQQLFAQDFCLSPEQIYRCLKENPKQCLIIIDGLDELNSKGEECVTKLVQGDILRYVNLMLAGRPEVSNKFVTYVTAHLLLKGFTEENVQSYVYKYFSEDNDLATRLLHRLRRDSRLTDLSKTPFTALLLCVLAEDTGGELPRDIDKIYHQVISAVFRKYAQKQTKKCAQDSECAHGKECAQGGASSTESEDVYVAAQSSEDAKCTETTLLKRAAELAYMLTKSREQRYLEKELPGICEDASHLLKSGILNRDFTLSRMDAQEYCCFAHRSIQEYLCALHLSTLSNADLAMEVKELEPGTSLQTWAFFVNIALREKIYTALSKIDIVWNVWNNQPHTDCIITEKDRILLDLKQNSDIMFSKLYAINAVCESSSFEVAVGYLGKRLFKNAKDAFSCMIYLRHIFMYYPDSAPIAYLNVLRKMSIDKTFQQHAYKRTVSRIDVPVLLRLNYFVLPSFIRRKRELSVPPMDVSITSIPNKGGLQDIKNLELYCTSHMFVHLCQQVTILAVDQQHDDNLWKRFLQLTLEMDNPFPAGRLIRLRPTTRVEARVHPETKLSRTVCVDCTSKTPPQKMYYDKFCPY